MYYSIFLVHLIINVLHSSTHIFCMPNIFNYPDIDNFFHTGNTCPPLCEMAACGVNPCIRIEVKTTHGSWNGHLLSLPVPHQVSVQKIWPPAIQWKCCWASSQASEWNDYYLLTNQIAWFLLEVRDTSLWQWTISLQIALWLGWKNIIANS